jgi:hypothetical protein
VGAIGVVRAGRRHSASGCPTERCICKLRVAAESVELMHLVSFAIAACYWQSPGTNKTSLSLA